MFTCILAAVDMNDPEGATRVAQAAILLAQSKDCQVHLVNVVPDSGMAMVSILLGPEQSHRMVDEAKSALEAWAVGALPADLDAQLHVTQGTIYDRIIQTADELGADAIVVGAHRPGLQDYLIGPNSARVARHAHQSVFVIR